MTEGAERLSGLVGGEGLVAQAELLVPELEDSLDRGLSHVPMRVARLVGFGVAAEEAPLFEVSFGGQVTAALVLGHLLDGDLAEVFVALFLLDLVPLQNVVEAVGVDVGVGSPAATAHGVLRQDVLLALAPFEDHLRPMDLVAIAVAGVIHDVSVHDAHGVAGVPAVDDHQNRERLVPQANETQTLVLGVGVVE